VNDQSILDKVSRWLETDALCPPEIVQSLWSNYGQIERYCTADLSQSLIVKHVDLPNDIVHPRGWNTDLSHQRKIRSYQVESHWYKHYASRCDAQCRVAHCYEAAQSARSFLMVLEDLDSAGFARRFESLSYADMRPCIRWLAYFHACFLGAENEGLWSTGSYWHLDTRPDELQALDDQALKRAAQAIDQKLRQSPFQTLIHGDAKLANFCFSQDGQHVAAVDFQYVGGGCGMKDLAYFIGSCLYEEDCARYESEILNDYFGYLQQALVHYNKRVDFGALEASWRALFKYAWADFHRFLKGWSPGHWKVNSYSEKISKEVINELGY